MCSVLEEGAGIGSWIVLAKSTLALHSAIMVLHRFFHRFSDSASCIVNVVNLKLLTWKMSITIRKSRHVCRHCRHGLYFAGTSGRMGDIQISHTQGRPIKINSHWSTDLNGSTLMTNVPYHPMMNHVAGSQLASALPLSKEGESAWMTWNWTTDKVLD